MNNNEMICENCNKSITDKHYGFSVCDSCEAEICINCLTSWNECPVCGKEITFEENF
jgi:predicted RNA-binding Zn-ribbon protein involved in translation (DUF1610 family)